MSLADDLLKQARHLALREPKKPKQASLRRAVSAAYYALFHELVADASRFLIGGQRTALRGFVARAFQHGEMRQVAEAFDRPELKPALAEKLGLANSRIVSGELRQVAQAVIELQQARHEADYNTLKPLSRRQALASIAQAEQAFSAWGKARKSASAEAFLVCLLVYARASKR